jgi:hypothetical protein
MDDGSQLSGVKRALHWASWTRINTLKQMSAERRHHRPSPSLPSDRLVDYMGLLKRLLGDEPEPPQDVRSARDTRWVEDVERFGDIRVDVVGESHYQPAIRAACNWKPGADTLFHCVAELVPEPTNPYDRNAIKVTIDGACVGHLSRQDAVTLGSAVREAIKRQGSGMCRAVIAGRANSDTDNLGVFLHLDAEFG